MPKPAEPDSRDARLVGLATNVRARRKALRLTQTELADLAGTSMRFVHTLENAKGTLRLDKVLDVLSVLGLDLRVDLATPGPTGPTPEAGDDR